MSIDNEFGQPPRLLPRTIEEVLRAWMVRGGGITLIAATCLIWGAMLTWSANDPSLSLNTSEPAQNLLGTPGAMIADFFFHTLGLSVVFFVVPPLVLGLQLTLGETVTDHRRRLALFAVATVAIAGGCSALPLIQYWPMELGYGGILGDFAYSVIGGILAEAAPEAGGAIAGVLYFALGFWAFSRAICLDRYNVLDMRLPRLHAAQRTDDGLAAGTGSKLGLASRFRRMAPAKPREATAQHVMQAHTQFAEPEPPSWGPDARMQEYAPAAVCDDGEAQPARRPSIIHGAGPDVDRRIEHGIGPDPEPVFYSEHAPQSAPDAHFDRVPAHIWDGPRGGAPDVESQPAQPMAGTSMLSRLAARLAPADAPPGGLPAVAATAEHHTILLDDELTGASDDLPNVLKRARQEAAELLPPALAAQLAPEPEAPAPPPLPPFARQPYRPEPPRHDLPTEDFSGQIRSARMSDAGSPKVVATGYRRPSLNLLKAQRAAVPSADASPSVLQGRARMLEDVLADFRINGEIRDVRPGPVITLFELEPSRGMKSSRVIALADDVARSMSATSARIAVVPGRNAIGIELPNTRRETFGLRELIDSQAFVDSGAKLPLVLGKGIGGEPVMADLARMPHLLVAGTTGSGKSVGVNAMILSLIYRLGPQDCRFLMIDPKMLELSAYNGIPHLLTPVVTDPQKAITALSWAVGEMEERYKRMAELGVRSIEAFNNRVKHAARMGERLGRTVQTGFDPTTGEAVFEETSVRAEPLPYIVIVVDEFADLMAVAGKEIEGLVQRLAQMARAAGIHMIMATQRPSVDVVTGTIKANFPTRISYRVASRIDSRTILNEQGGEQLLGQGDMLFLDGAGNVQRVHGPFVADEEVEAVSNWLRGSYAPDYVDDVLAGDEGRADAGATDGTAKPGDLYEQAVEIVLRDQKASTSYLQRRLAIGYNRAADLIDRMETEGVIGAANHAGRREILLAG